jgi:hypothetical protein
MPDPAKLVTIVTDFATEGTVERELHELGIVAFTAMPVRGRGRHGEVRGGILLGSNVEFQIVCSGPTLDKLLSWAERELVPHYPGIVWVQDVGVIQRDRGKPKRAIPPKGGPAL